jgi:hypothetical protein
MCGQADRSVARRVSTTATWLHPERIPELDHRHGDAVRQRGVAALVERMLPRCWIRVVLAEPAFG